MFSQVICIYPGCKLPTKVIATRQPGKNIITRRRECPEQHRFTTIETVKGRELKKSTQASVVSADPKGQL